MDTFSIFYSASSAILSTATFRSYSSQLPIVKWKRLPCESKTGGTETILLLSDSLWTNVLHSIQLGA